MSRCRGYLALFSLAAVSLVAGGCAEYRLGTTLPPKIRTVCVPTFANKTGEPQLEQRATQATIQEIQKDGTLIIADLAQADSVLAVTLVRYRLEALRFEKESNKTADEYRLVLEADLLLTYAKSGEPVMKRTVSGETTFLPGGDLNSAKQQALPKAAADLARNVVGSIVEFW
jgi:hypothetical protein